MASYQEFLDALAQSESSGNYKIVNSFDYLGKYQFGEEALKDLGYYKGDGTNIGPYQDWIGAWTGNDGVESRAEFLNSPTAQEHAVREWFSFNWSYIEEYDLDGYLGKSIHGIEITASGMLAGLHLGGSSNLEEFLESDGKKVFVDAYGTKITDYISELGNYDTPFDDIPSDLIIG